MIDRKYLILPLAAALVLPAAAQEPQSTDQSQTQTVSDQSNTTTATQKQPLQIETREGFWGKLNPFARKKYVQRQLSPVAGRVNELDSLTAENARFIKDVDSRAQEGIRVASLKANEADQRAVAAGQKAEQAHGIATQASTRLVEVEKVVETIDQYQPATEVEIRLRPGQTTLSKNAKAALDEVVTPMKDQRGYIIEIQGYASGSGAAAIENSQRMAEAVSRYLVLNHEIPVYRIFIVGMGNAPVQKEDEDGKVRRVRGTRVEVRLLKNGVGEMASLNSAPMQSESSMPQSDAAAEQDAQQQ